jgi:hypothetical protein
MNTTENNLWASSKEMISTEIPEEVKDYTKWIAKICLLILCILMSIEILSGRPLL